MLKNRKRIVTSDELRQDFLKFFESKGHTVVPSSSLIPHGDPTLLLTTAGVVQFQPFYLGEAVPDNPRMASCQKCFRTTDIDSVGDAGHLTFFEMLGNFSIGEYFKKEAIAWAWEFVTEHLKLSPERMWITVLQDDDEAIKLWRGIGIPDERIIRLTEKDNFWGPAGDSGPCGPCSEIHVDLGENAECDKPVCAPGCDCGRWLEIWDLVFTQYNQDKSGKRTPLPHPNIDTGMGLERTITLLQGKTTVYDTDIFIHLLESVSKLCGKKYGTDKDIDLAMRVVAEHSRGITFLIADGVLPSNEGRGYVLRRLLRREVLFAKKLGVEKPFLAEMVAGVISQMKHAYPELEQRGSFILKVVDQEESRFRETLNTGLELLDGIIEVASGKDLKQISGAEAFKLYDTYGFPVEMTKEIAAERGFTVDLAGFEKEMDAQRERARAAHKFVRAEGGKAGKTDVTETVFTGYKKLKQRTSVLDIMIKDEYAGAIEAGQEASLILKETPFYGEMGGQVGDTGEIRSAKAKFTVTNTVRMPPNIIIHQWQVTEGIFTLGDKVEAEVDAGRRKDIARNHTATHLLQAALRQVLGEHIQQRGSLVTPDRFRFDFSHLVAMTKDEIERAQQFVNEKIRQDLKVYAEEMPYKKAVETGAIALFDEKYGDTVRVLRVGKPAVSAELCGGTHAETTGEIGFFQILSESSVGAGLRRIEAVTGRGAEEYIRQKMLDLEKIAGYLETKPDEAAKHVESIVTDLKNEHRQLQLLNTELARLRAESLASHADIVNGVKVLAVRVPSAPVEALREMSDLLQQKLNSVIIVLGTVSEERPIFLATVTPDLVAKGYDAGRIIKEVAHVAGGGGGGKPTMAQAGGKDKTKLDEALRHVREYLEEKETE